ncbi:hypothetical protein [Armatimonas sp.]|uniref:hypothetical protein n=1 Tax=Armatimonas sp. TaxID=1872638 RepID=UPI00286A2914|nr:hypothetical protein [Armatimonas sp.]
MQNRIDATFSDQDRDEVLAAIATIRAKLPFLQNATLEDRQELLKLGPKSEVFAVGMVDLATQDDSFLPRSFELEEPQQDRALREKLRPIRIEITRLNEALDDTDLLLGSDLYVAALEIYAAAKQHGRSEANDTLLAEFGRRFARQGKKKASDPNP